jgi:hypothetical protein
MSLPPNGWFEIAQDLETRLRDVEPGWREAAISRFGEERGLALETVRAYGAARRHLHSIAKSQPELAQALRAAPVDSITALARWSQHDPSGASDAANKVAANQLSVRQVKEGARAAQVQNTSTYSKKEFIDRITRKRELYWPRSETKRILDDYTRFQIELNSVEIGKISTFKYDNYRFGGDIYVVPNYVLRNKRIDLFAGDGDWRVAILVVGPYRVSEYYSRRHVDWLLLAVAAAHFFKRVALFFCEGADIKPFRRWLANEDSANQLDISLVRETKAGEFQIVGRSEASEESVSSESAGSEQVPQGETAEHNDEAIEAEIQAAWESRDDSDSGSSP